MNLQELIKQLRKDTYYLDMRHMGGGIGDSYMLLSISQDEAQKALGAPIIFIIDKKREILFRLFEKDNYLVCEDLIFNNTYLPKLNFVSKNPTLGKIAPTNPYQITKNYKLKTHLFTLYTRLLGLPDSTMPLPTKHYPTLNPKLKADIEKIAPLEKILFYLPESNTSPRLPYCIFARDVAFYKDLGYTIIVNAPKESYFHKDTLRFDLTLEEAIALGGSAGKVISVRSGLCDIIAREAKDMLVYYEHEQYLQICSLKFLDPQIQVKEIVIDSLEFLAQSNTDSQMALFGELKNFNKLSRRRLKKFSLGVGVLMVFQSIILLVILFVLILKNPL
ncbi:hypothetical protein ACRE1S_03675 [Helicobacter himalayensis]|uniref:hypothetical protein n=1 Tax=Helicobacter himalayensis TaxID=1591088 RepID=UPI003D6FE403